ncbi:MAG: IS21 family transposase, partial [Syntrophomonadaceae bacterium]|nr:IS21 family transposase [Syntrophomonadaceae bacterium]
MPRRVSMIEHQDIIHRLRLGQSVKAIHRETGRHKTVVRTLKALAQREGWLEPGRGLPGEAEIQQLYDNARQLVRVITHPLDVYREQVAGWLKKGYSFVVIHRLLVRQGASCSEATARRWIHRHFPDVPLPVIVRPTTPGEVMEVDFGYLGLFWDPQRNVARKTWFFSGRLRHSRRVYREVVFEQTKECFFACHIHAFEHFRGVPQKVVPDNLKAAILKASVENPLVNRAYRSLAEHYGFLISPCLPASPQHKGGVESDVKYVKRNFLPLFREAQAQRGQQIPSVQELRQELERWNREVAEARLVGKVGRTPVELFEQEELSALQPLPPCRWEPVVFKEASVGPDWRIQFQKAFYSVPYRLIGERVLVMAGCSFVRIFFEGQEVTLHRRAARLWEYVWKSEHAPPQLEQFLASSTQGLLIWAQRLGNSVVGVAEAILADKAVDGIRPVRALVRLAERYGSGRLQAACERALRFHT